MSAARDRLPAGLELRTLTELQPHPQAAEVPQPSNADFVALKDDLAARGLQHPLDVTSTGTILDGHARHRALLELGVLQALVLVVKPADEVEHMLLAAIRRRQLTPSQRSALAVKVANIAEYREAASARRQQNLRRGPDRATLPDRDDDAAAGVRTRDMVAALAATGARNAQDALTVHDHDLALFQRIVDGGLSAGTAASKVRRALRDAAIPAAPPLPEGPFELIVADPPWSMGSPDSEFAPEQHYPCMTTADIKAIQVPAADNSVIFIWAVTCLLPEALQVLAAWGFTYKSCMVWVKSDGIGPGKWLRHRHELLLIGTRGNVSPPDPEERVDSVIEAKRGRHSEKPELAYQRIETMYPQLTKLELFARNTRPGWSSWGNEAPTSASGETE